MEIEVHNMAEKLTLQTAWERPDPSERMPADAYREYCEREDARAYGSVNGFVPVGGELDCLVEYWLCQLIDIEWCWACGQVGGGAEHARMMFAYDRLDAIVDAIGQEAFNIAFEAAVKKYARAVDPTAWRAFLQGEKLDDVANGRLFVVPQSALRRMDELSPKG
jgi:hypothetical protein